MNPIEVVTDLDLSEDQKSRVISMVLGNGAFDYEGNFESRDGAHVLKSIHFMSDPSDIPGGETSIDGVDDIVFDKSPHIYLEDEGGKIYGWLNTRELKTSSWHYGVIFSDDEDRLWFYGRDTIDGDRVSLNMPILMRIRTEPSRHVLAENGPLLESVPAEGEFWISKEEDPVVTMISWWSGFAGPDMEGQDFSAEREILTTLKARAQIMMTASDPAP